ncbi:MAG: PAS domain-containing sensor histidine kinase [Fidelibacterota bacterium]
MNIYRHSVNIKSGLFLLGVTLIGLLLVYSQSIVNKLRDDNREIVQLYAEIIASTIKDQSDTNLNFVFDEIIKKVRFPIIYSDNKHIPIYTKNIPQDMTQDDLLNYQRIVDVSNKPIPLEYIHDVSGETIIIGYLHFGDSSLITQLRWFPYLEIGAVALFIILGFAGFSIIRNSEKRHIWVGMARETAHQLGTPVSALLGWIDLMKNHPEKTEQALTEMSIDTKRLEQIVDRFSKMGRDTKKESVNIKLVVDEVRFYLERRLPSLGKNVTIQNNLDKSIFIQGNGILLSWALENVIKNAIDAVDHKNGLIEISGKIENNQFLLHITDNGKGIPRKDWKNIFRPGFSSKQKGWGLGLSLVKRIVEEIHSGKIEVVKPAENKGTVFKINLPL